MVCASTFHGQINGISSFDSGVSEGADKNDPTHPPNLSSTIPASTPVLIPPIRTHSARSTHPQFPDSVCRLLLLNSRSISPAASGESRWKLPFIQSTLLEDSLSPPVLVLGMSETWLLDSVSNAQTDIKDYQCIRPPDSPDCDFSSCIEKPQQFICDHSKDEREANVYVLGDFKLPHFNWEECKPPSSPPNAAYNTLMNFIEAMNEALNAVNWVLLKALCDDCGDADSTLFKELIVLTVLQITSHLSPSKISLDKKGKSKLDKELASLKMKKRKLHHLQNTNPSSRKMPS
ncbi:hypothetical protein ACHWQZ_G017523 [Mnemiopsis leidyi]